MATDFLFLEFDTIYSLQPAASPIFAPMMLLGSAFLPALNVPSAARAPARAPAATMGVKAPQSMEGAFVKSRNTLGIQAIRPDVVVPKELRAAIASTFPAKGETTAITEAEVLELGELGPSSAAPCSSA